jgi:hypothetical protein
MVHRVGTLLSRLLVVALAVAFALAPEMAAASCGWTVISGPDVGPSQFTGVSAISPSDAWAVGTQTSGSLAEHWDGTMWTVVSSASVPGLYVTSVSAASPSDVWIAGIKPSDHGLTEHWDGHVWTVVAITNPNSYHNELRGVAAISPSDAWVVGEYQVMGIKDGTLIEHWDGHAWTVVPSPNPGNESSNLWGVSGVSPSDVWAVGYFNDDTLTEHWNGQAWTVVPSPNTYYKDLDQLFAVSARTSSDVWAVGSYGNSHFEHTLVEHWNGHAWKIIPSPQPPGNTANTLTGVSATSSSDAWAVGYSVKGDNSRSSFTEHWDGRVWTVIPSANPGTTNELFGTSATSPSDAWAAGFYVGTDHNGHTLLEHGKC